MKKPSTAPANEPVGIVISLSAINEQPTVFSAYVWGPAPRDEAPTKSA